MRKLQVGRLAIIAGGLLVTSPLAAQSKKGQGLPTVSATACKKVAVGTAAVSTAVASVGSIASAAGVSAVAHSSGAAILTSVGVGGTGYVAGTLGGLAASALAVVSSPAVIAGAAVAAVGAGGGYLYCRNKQN